MRDGARCRSSSSDGAVDVEVEAGAKMVQPLRAVVRATALDNVVTAGLAPLGSEVHGFALKGEAMPFHLLPPRFMGRLRRKWKKRDV